MFQPHNLVNIRFIYSKISGPEWEIMLCGELSEFLVCTAITCNSMSVNVMAYVSCFSMHCSCRWR